MSSGATAAGGAAVAAAIANAVKASGVLIRVEPGDFQAILSRTQQPLVVCARGGFFNKDYRYLVSHGGFAFYTRSPEPLSLPGGAQTVMAKRIWIPG